MTIFLFSNKFNEPRQSDHFWLSQTQHWTNPESLICFAFGRRRAARGNEGFQEVVSSKYPFAKFILRPKGCSEDLNFENNTKTAVSYCVAGCCKKGILTFITVIK